MRNAILAVAAVVGALTPAVGAPPYYLHLLILTFIFGLLAMSLNLLLGYTGLPSFGHAAYFGVAAYTAGVLAVRHQVGFWPAAAAGVLAALVLGVAFGLMTVRSRGVYFLLITLALGQVVWGLAFRWVSMTGGDNGLPGIPRPGFSFLWPLVDVRGYYLFTLAVLALCTLLLYAIAESPFGYALRGIRENEARMRTLGYPIEAYVYAAFVLSAGFAGIAGALYAFYNGFVSPKDLHLAVSARTLLTVIVGGAGTLLGPLAGSAFLVFLENLLSTYTQRWMMVIGVLYILVVLYTPQGIAGLLARLRRRPSPPVPALPVMPEEVPPGSARERISGRGDS